MSCEDSIHVGQVGFGFRGTVKDKNTGSVLSISGYDLKQIFLLKPDDDGTIVTKNANFVTNGEDGQLQYITTSGVIDVDGIWRYQFKVGSGTADIFHSDVFDILVKPNIVD